LSGHSVRNMSEAVRETVGRTSPPSRGAVRCPVPDDTAALSPRLLDLKQAAAYLGVSYWTVRDWVLAGRVPAISLPGLRPREGARARQTLRRALVDLADLDAFVDRCKDRG
jgi:excisionase family DNA binding protein